MTNEVPTKTPKNLQAVAQMAADLRQGNHFGVTRLRKRLGKLAETDPTPQTNDL